MSRSDCTCRHFAWDPNCPVHPGHSFVRSSSETGTKWMPRLADELSYAKPGIDRNQDITHD